VRGYNNPYEKDSLARPDNAGMRDRSGVYNPRKQNKYYRSGHLRSRLNRRLVRNLDRGPFEGRDRDPFTKKWRGPHGRAARGPYDRGGRAAPTGVSRARRGHRTPHTPHSYGRNSGYPRHRGLTNRWNRPELDPRDMGKRELKDLIKQLQTETPKSDGKTSELKDAEKELHKRELTELDGGAGLLGLGDAFKPPVLFAKQFHPREAYQSPSDRGVVPVAALKKWSKREFGARSRLRESARAC